MIFFIFSLSYRVLLPFLSSLILCLTVGVSSGYLFFPVCYAPMGVSSCSLFFPVCCCVQKWQCLHIPHSFLSVAVCNNGSVFLFFILSCLLLYAAMGVSSCSLFFPVCCCVQKWQCLLIPHSFLSATMGMSSCSLLFPVCFYVQQWECRRNEDGKLRIYKCRAPRTSVETASRHCQCTDGSVGKLRRPTESREMQRQMDFLRHHVNKRKIVFFT